MTKVLFVSFVKGMWIPVMNLIILFNMLPVPFLIIVCSAFFYFVF